MNVRKEIRRFSGVGLVTALLLLAALAFAPQPSSAGSLSTSVIGMFPKEVGEFTYADLKSARKFPWFNALKEQLLPSHFRDFEKFLASTGVDPNTQVDELAWGAVSATKTSGEEIVGVALGTFNPSSSEDRFKSQKLPMFDYHGYHMYAFGSGSGAGDILFMFVDSNTAAFGSRPALEKLVDVRTGTTESLLSNDFIFPLINESNGNGLIWAVLDKGYAHMAMQQLLPEASQFAQAAPIMGRIKGMTIYVSADSGIDAHFQAVCSTTDDANLLAAGMQGALMMRRYQEAQSHPDLAGALDQVRIAPAGDRLKIELPVTQDQLQSMIKSRALATTM
jgi:hypothetical protein